MMTVEDETSFREREETVGGPLKSRLHALNPALFPLPAGGRFRSVGRMVGRTGVYLGEEKQMALVLLTIVSVLFCFCKRVLFL